MKASIHELELNFSNICGAECLICSRPHGCGNKALMDWDVFNTLIEQLKDVDFEMIQTSGNGEAFLNPNYLDYIATLRKEFPDKTLWTYNNFSQWTPERSDRIIKEKLFDKIHVRIDGLEKWEFERNSNLNQDIVFSNLKYFLKHNTDIPVVILYNNVNDYYQRCKRLLNKRPVRDFFNDADLSRIKDCNYMDHSSGEIKNRIVEHFQPYSKVQLEWFRIGHSLWGERTTCEPDNKYPCPKFNIISGNIWVCPNGDLSVCCYDDRQADYICGNVMEEHLGSLFNGSKRAEILSKISERRYKDYPCTNPICCVMGDEFPKGC